MDFKHFAFFLSVILALSGCSDSQPGKASEDLATDTLAMSDESPQVKAISKRILDDPGNAALYNERALVYLKLRQPAASVNDARRAIRLDSTNAAYYMTLVDAYFSENSTRQAKDLLHVVERKFPGNTDALLKLAELYWLVRQYQKGLDYVNKALKIDENIARAYYIKGGIYRESGDTTRAISSLETAVEQDNGFADAFYDLGVIYSARKNPLGLQYFDNVLRIYPGHSDALYGRAKLLQDMGRTEQAIAEYREIIASDSTCARCHYNLGAIMLELRKNNKEALEHFSAAISLEPGNPQHYFARAYTYTKLKDVESARADYRMCLKIDPDFEPAVEGLNALEKK